ncbi:hypothetical protein [Aminobacter anthyllidis]|uniref:hypothetical protein n=1 Tax=Aminobacter anthyllidis TaxID=1035067 RepID=UPI001FE89E8F
MWTDLIFNVFLLAIAAADATSFFFVLSVSNCGDPRQLVLRHLTDNDRLHGRGRREPAFFLSRRNKRPHKFTEENVLGQYFFP